MLSPKSSRSWSISLTLLCVLGALVGCGGGRHRSIQDQVREQLRGRGVEVEAISCRRLSGDWSCRVDTKRGARVCTLATSRSDEVEGLYCRTAQ